MSTSFDPLTALRQGHWVKLICGASYHHLPAVRNLALTYALAGVDCIDVAAEPGIVTAAWEGIEAAVSLQRKPVVDRGSACEYRPWLMVSLNDGEDPHFRKAVFDPVLCPADCSRPCESICPAQAITFAADAGYPLQGGVVESRCYGCGRCLPICPQGIISAQAQVVAPQQVLAGLLPQIDAVEIHTQVGRDTAFERLWGQISPHLSELRLISISCPESEGVIDYFARLWHLIQPLPIPLIWQTDGRSMTGDIGKGATTATIRFARKILSAGLPGYVQVAGGTNDHTVPKLRQIGLARDQCVEEGDEVKKVGQSKISGVAYGSYARKLLMPVLAALEASEQPSEAVSYGGMAVKRLPFDKGLGLTASSKVTDYDLENHPDLLQAALQLAHPLVSQLKPASSQMSWPVNLKYASEVMPAP